MDRLGSRIPRWRWLRRLFDFPGVRPLGRRAYRWIADHRMQLSCSFSGRADGPA